MQSLDHRHRRPVRRGKGHGRARHRRTLGYRHVDSGAMYRAVGWKALASGVPLDDEAAVPRIAEQSHIEVVRGASSPSTAST